MVYYCNFYNNDDISFAVNNLYITVYESNYQNFLKL